MALSPEFERISTRYRKAMSYAMTDPEAALNECRKTAEAICKQIYSELAAAYPDAKELKKPVMKMMLNDLAFTIEKHQAVPKVVSTAIRTIQAFGNLGAHDQGVEADHITTETVRPCLSATTTLVNWFWGDRELDSKYLKTPFTVLTASHSTVTSPNDPSKLKFVFGLIVMGSVVAFIASSAGLFSDGPNDETENRQSVVSPSKSKMSSNDDVQKAASAVMSQQRSKASDSFLNAVTQNLGEPAPPRPCVPMDSRLLDELTKAAKSLSGGQTGTNRPEDKIVFQRLGLLTPHRERDAVRLALKGKAALNIGKHLVVLEDAQKASKACPNWALPYNLYGTALMLKEPIEIDKAEKAYRKALSLSPDYAKAQFNWAMIAMIKRRFKLVITRISNLLKTSPKHPNAHYLRAYAQYELGQMQEAETDARLAIEHEFKNANAHYLLGKIRSQKNDQTSAKKEFCIAKALGHEEAEKQCNSSSR